MKEIPEKRTNRIKEWIVGAETGGTEDNFQMSSLSAWECGVIERNEEMS